MTALRYYLSALAAVMLLAASWDGYAQYSGAVHEHLRSLVSSIMRDAGPHSKPDSPGNEKHTSMQLTSKTSEAEALVRRSPLHAEAWLDLASAAMRSPDTAVRTASFLQMSYLVAPDDRAVISRRLRLAAQSDLLSEPDIQDLVKSGLRVLASRGGCQFDDILQAADSAGKMVISKLIREVSLCGRG